MEKFNQSIKVKSQMGNLMDLVFLLIHMVKRVWLENGRMVRNGRPNIKTKMEK